MTPCSCYHNYDMLIKKLEYFIMKQYKKCEKSPYFFLYTYTNQIQHKGRRSRPP